MYVHRSSYVHQSTYVCMYAHHSISVHCLRIECLAQCSQFPFPLDVVPGANFLLRPIQKLYILTTALSHSILLIVELARVGILAFS